MQEELNFVELLADFSLQSVCPDVNACTEALTSDLHVSMST